MSTTSEMRIEALEKHALAQEIKINTLEKLVNDLIMSAGYSLHSGPFNLNEHHSPEQRLDWVRCMKLQEIRLSLFEKEAPCYAEMVQRIRNHQPCRGATTLTTFQHKVLQEAEASDEAAEEVEQFRVREAHAMLRAAELRSAKAKLRGTPCRKGVRASSSSDPTTWTKEKAEHVSKLWCE